MKIDLTYELPEGVKIVAIHFPFHGYWTVTLKYGEGQLDLGLVYAHGSAPDLNEALARAHAELDFKRTNPSSVAPWKKSEVPFPKPRSNLLGGIDVGELDL